MIGKAITYLTNWYVVVNNKIAIASQMAAMAPKMMAKFANDKTGDRLCVRSVRLTLRLPMILFIKPKMIFQ